MGFGEIAGSDIDLDNVPCDVPESKDEYVPGGVRRDEIYFSGEESDFEEEEEVQQQKKLGHRKVSFESPQTPDIPSIFSLPPELWLEIFSYLAPTLLSTELVTVCRAFHYFLTSEEFWEMRLRQNVGSTITKSQHESFLKIGLPYVCHAMEQCSTSFKPGVRLSQRTVGHAGDVHCVKLMKRYKLGLSGSRDKTIQVYDLKRGENNKLRQSSDLLVKTDSSHNGWVWCLAQEQHHSKLMSGSWDGFAHVYDVAQDMSLIDRIEVGSAVLCGVFEPNVVMYGTYSKYIGAYDTRSGKREMKITTSHNRPILSLAASEHYIWSTGEDTALSCHDRRAGRLFKRIKLQRISTAIDYCAPYLWFGGYDGSIKCYNSDMKSVKKFDSAHKGPITGLKHALGATLTSSKDCTVKVYSPSIQPVEWQTLGPLAGDVSCVDYNDGVVMAGDCNMNVTFWYHE